MQNKSVAELLADLNTVDLQAPDKRWQAAEALGKLQRVPEYVAPALITALSSTFDALARSHAAESLGTLGDLRAVPALIHSLSDQYRLTRAYAARALGKLGDVLALEPLLRVMRSEDEFFGVRAEAAEALGKLCEGRNTDQCRRVRNALLAHRRAEQERHNRGEEEGRAVRVIGEVDRSLRRLGELLEQAEFQTREIELAAERGDRGKLREYAAALRNTLGEARSVVLGFA